jgi:hypothetical protein
LRGNESIDEMTNWERAITEKNMERTLSIVFQLQNVNDFEKSIVDSFSGAEDFRIEKTGKEVKEKLQIELTIIAGDKIAAVAKMEALVAIVGSLPNGSAERYYFQGFERHIGSVPKVYGYDQLYPKQTQVPDSDVLATDNLVPANNIKSSSEKMREYNQIATDYIHRCVEEIKLKTVMGNLSDGKKIKLSPQLASELGF